ncbi:ABC transporter substrate-binding protein [Corynebacterium choanae]|uniref:Putative monoacyl phosphatidylinositol tetramannoside-binding protein LpqW n=1 Tax=Corynebacterium choanae TaxID=1862358 RepID=A0A3G6J6V3_9CORY|nr:ABC transporter substrate-binding protein [Corynebacterium choanae]AZA13696.1 putative monoacyl phosphatidylinositol tetramannoside-binding protein LpqW precursor [Corynebacterium choanae]
MDETRHGMSPRRPWRQIVSRVGAAMLLLVGCAEQPTDQSPEMEPTITYAAGVDQVTLNAGSAEGVSTRADMLSARIYPGVFVWGPGGQFVPNTDIATAQLLPGAQRSAVYRINVDARYSDGVPLTCTDFLLAWRAQVTEGFAGFAPVYDQVEKVFCEPGARKFIVTFKEDYGDRWQELFATGQVLPSHTIAQRAGVSMEELNDMLLTGDPSTLAPIAEIWNTGFRLSSFDPTLAVASGPYQVVAVDPGVSVTLAANPQYLGDEPQTARIVIYAFGKEPSGNGELPAPDVADLTWLTTVPWVHDAADTQVTTVTPQAGSLTDSLVLARGGLFADAANRRAFAACIDQQTVAAVSAEISGIEVHPVGARLVHTAGGEHGKLADIAQAHIPANMEAAAPLRGAVIRIGHLPGHRRYAAMVDAIAQSCAPAGVTVVDASDDYTSLGALQDEYGQGNIDAFLTPLSTREGFSRLAADTDDPTMLRAEEQRLWEEVLTIPLADEPRVAIVHNTIGQVVPNTAETGIGWNMDRWTILAPGKEKVTPNTGS